jgi:hypothetical protein
MPVFSMPTSMTCSGDRTCILKLSSVNVYQPVAAIMLMPLTSVTC